MVPIYAWRFYDQRYYMKLPTNYRSQLGEVANYLLDKDWLDEHYRIKGLSTRQIGALIGCGKKAVTTALKRHNIPINYKRGRNPEGHRKSFLQQVSPSVIGKLDDKDWLYSNYIILNRSALELAQDLGVSMKTLRRWLKKFLISKPENLRLECSERRYTESQGFEPTSEEACKKRMQGRRGCRLTTNKAGSIWCHSSWEKDVALFLDNDDRVLAFSKDSIKIHYRYDGKQRLYYPDFMVKLENRILIVEVKAARLLSDNRVQAKLEALHQYCAIMCFIPIVLTGTKSVDPTKIFEEI